MTQVFNSTISIVGKFAVVIALTKNSNVLPTNEIHSCKLKDTTNGIKKYVRKSNVGVLW